jgi:hypothetical protein
VLAAIGLALARTSDDDGAQATGSAVTRSLDHRGAQHRSRDRRGAPETIAGSSTRPRSTASADSPQGRGGVWVGELRERAARRSRFREPSRLVHDRLAVPHVAESWRSARSGSRTGPSDRRINPATDELLRPIDLRRTRGSPSPRTSPAGSGAVWVAQGGESSIGSIRPRSDRRRSRIEGSSGLAAGDDGVWLIDNLSGALTAFDPRPVDVTATTTLPATSTRSPRGVGPCGSSTPASARSRSSMRTLEVTGHGPCRGRRERGSFVGAMPPGSPTGTRTPSHGSDALTRDVTTFPMRGPVRGRGQRRAGPGARLGVLARAK